MEETTADTPYIYFDNKIYNNFFITDDPSEKKEKGVLLEEFFINFGLYQPMDEVMRFWEYHEQTGRMSNGQKIVSKKSASHFWKIDEQTARRQSDEAHKLISRIYSALPEHKRPCLIAELINIQFSNGEVKFIIETEQLFQTIESEIDKVSAILRSAYGDNVSLLYTFRQ